jgi:hypothetical protein
MTQFKHMTAAHTRKMETTVTPTSDRLLNLGINIITRRRKMRNFCFVDSKNLMVLNNSLFFVGFEATSDAKVKQIVPKLREYGPVGRD